MPLSVAATDAVERTELVEDSLCVGDTLAERVAEGDEESLLKLALETRVDEATTLRLTLTD